jgi:hypothetical protein
MRRQNLCPRSLSFNINKKQQFFYGSLQIRPDILLLIIFQPPTELLPEQTYKKQSSDKNNEKIIQNKFNWKHSCHKKTDMIHGNKEGN